MSRHLFHRQLAPPSASLATAEEFPVTLGFPEALFALLTIQFGEIRKRYRPRDPIRRGRIPGKRQRMSWNTPTVSARKSS